MSDAPSTPAAAPSPDPAATLRETVWSVSVDAAELSRQLPGDDASARILDKLAEEISEAAQMHRSLPRRPVEADGRDWQLLGSLRSAHAEREDIAEFVARGLARLAYELGGTYEVIANRDGSWEASHVAELLRGTVGDDLDAWKTVQ